MSTPAPDSPARQLATLVALAERVHDELTTGDFESSLATRNDYNDAFGRFQVTVAAGGAITPDLADDLRRLERLHAQNMAIVAGLRDTAKAQTGSAHRFKRIGGYAPNGANHVPVPRFVDDAA